MNEKVDSEGNSIMDRLFNDNCEEYTNNLMYIINNAFDKNGEKIDFISNKYQKLLKENDCVLACSYSGLRLVQMKVDNDKINAIEIRQNPFQKIFGSCNVRIYAHNRRKPFTVKNLKAVTEF